MRQLLVRFRAKRRTGDDAALGSNIGWNLVRVPATKCRIAVLAMLGHATELVRDELS